MVTGIVRLQSKPSCLLACILALFFIIPAIIYLAVAGKDQTYPFVIQVLPDGISSSVSVSGRGPALRLAQQAVPALP